MQDEKLMIGLLVECHSLMKKHKLNALKIKSLVVGNGNQGGGNQKNNK